jgi:hypothetical protein
MDDYQPTEDYQHLLMTEYDNIRDGKGQPKIEQWDSIKLEHKRLGFEFMDWNRLAWAELWNIRDKKRRDSETQEKLQKLMAPKIENLPVWMVTINYPKEFTKWQCILQVTESLKNLKWVQGLTAQYEYHTEKGGHPHTHMKIVSNNFKYTKADIIRAVYDVKDLKKYIPDKASIDVRKSNNGRADDYLAGEKCAKKRENVEKDRAWRIEVGLEDPKT